MQKALGRRLRGVRTMRAPSGPLGPVYSLHEAADHLRVSKQAVARAANRHGIGSRFGRELRFTDDDLKALLEAARCKPHVGLGRNEVSRPFVEERTFASLRKMAEAKRKATLAAREARRKS